MRLRAVLFDLDDTLFDHSRATAAALADLHAKEPAFAAWSADELTRRHGAVLEEMHVEVVAGRLAIPAAREERFRRLLEDAGRHGRVDGGRAAELAAAYRSAYEASWCSVSGAGALLTRLRADRIKTAIVTNNLLAEQEAKLQFCGLRERIDALVTSEETGIAKPDPRIFAQALDALGVAPGEAVMLGDAWATDIEGAIAAGVRPIWLNRRRLPAPRPGVVQIDALEPIEASLATIQRAFDLPLTSDL
jgi:HAD superfamily hydrolase (TIGR01509 family)